MLKRIDLSGAKGIFSRNAGVAGTYAHKDIAIKFAAWLSPEFELYLVEEIQKLKELEVHDSETRDPKRGS